ncbi:MAG TPA: DUF4349 domain-containing protein [Candidatus Limnocylindrales bacterium]|nr:DUF4349 domain-containing protein [Candidatus Limnocylindrales bacterium]
MVVAGVIAGCGAGMGAASPAALTDGQNGQSGSRAGAAASAGPAGGQDAPGVVQPGQGDNAAFRDASKIIRTGALQLEVVDVTASLNAARGSIVGMGGYIGASQQQRDGDNVLATITYRIPSERWEEALDALRKLGKEVGEQTDSADVAGQLVDLDARIRNLKASETALVKHLAEAARVSDVLEIESRLSDVRGQIEQLSAQKAGLDDQVAYATLTVTYGVEVQAVKQAAESWNPKNEVDRAGASLVGFLQALATAGIWFAIVWLPILLVLGIVAAAALFVARRLGLVRRASPPVPPLPPAPAGS